jgi:hypothetical protein
MTQIPGYLLAASEGTNSPRHLTRGRPDEPPGSKREEHTVVTDDGCRNWPIGSSPCPACSPSPWVAAEPAARTPRNQNQTNDLILETAAHLPSPQIARAGLRRRMGSRRADLLDRSRLS